MTNRLFLVGFMCSGKTKTGKLLAEQLGFDHVDTDQLIEQKFGKTVQEIFDEMGENRFREMEKNVLQELKKTNNIIISTGGGMPCFSENMQILNQLGFTVFLDVSADLVVQRVKNARVKRPLLLGKTDSELKKYVETLLEKRRPFYQQANFSIPVDNGNFEHIQAIITAYFEHKKQ